MVEKEHKEPQLGVSSLGHYKIERQLYNIDIPQDITTFRQIQESANLEESDRVKQYEKFYSKKAVDSDEVSKRLEEGLEVKGFIPTAGIIRITLGEEKIDVLATYPFSQLEEGKNLFLLGKGIDKDVVVRKEAEEKAKKEGLEVKGLISKAEEFKGELFYTEDLRDKKLSEIKVKDGLTLEEAKQIINQVLTNPLMDDVAIRLLEEYEKEDLQDEKNIREVIEKLKELAEEDNSIKDRLSLLTQGKPLEMAITVKDIIDKLQETRRIEGRALGFKTEFFPLNGIILGEDKDRKPVIVFSPERIDFNVKGIGIAEMLNRDVSYKIGNGLLTTMLNPNTLKTLLDMELTKKLGKEEDEKLKERRENLINRLEEIIKILNSVEEKRAKNKEERIIDERLYEIAFEMEEGLMRGDVKQVKRAIEALREWRDNKILELVKVPKVDVRDLLKPDMYTYNGKKGYFLRWNLSESNTPLQFYRELYKFTNMNGRIVKNNQNDVVLSNDIKIYLGGDVKVIHTNPEKGKTEKGTDIKIQRFFRPIGFAVSPKYISGENIYIFRLENANKKSKEIVEKIAKDEKIQTVESFMKALVKETGVKVKVVKSQEKVIRNVSFGKDLKGYALPIAKHIEAVRQEAKKIDKALRDIKDILEKLNENKIKGKEAKEKIQEKLTEIRDRINMSFRLIGGGSLVKKETATMRVLDKGVEILTGSKQRLSEFFSLEKLEQKLSRFQQATGYATLVKDFRNLTKRSLSEMNKIFEEIEKKNAVEMEDIKKLIEKGNKYINFLEKGYPKKFIEETAKAVRDMVNGLKNLQREEKKLKLKNEILAKPLKEMSIEERKFAVELAKEFYRGLINGLNSDGMYMAKRILEENGKKQIAQFLENELNIRRIKEQLEYSTLGKIKPTSLMRRLDRAVEYSPREDVEKAPFVLKGDYVLVEFKDIDTVKERTPSRTAKGEEPFVAKNEYEAEEKAKKLLKVLKEKLPEEVNLFVQVRPAYKIKDTDKYVLSVQVLARLGNNMIDIDKVEVNPQPKVIPTVESITETLRRKGLFKNIKNFLDDIKRPSEELINDEKVKIQQTISKEEEKTNKESLQKRKKPKRP